jgi:hypothetical protein
MRIFYSLLVLLLSIVVLFSCENTAASPDVALAKRATVIAQSYCQCTGHLVSLNQQMVQAGSDTATTNQLFKAIADAYTRAEACTDSILMIQGHLSPALMESVKQSVSTQCPEVAAHPDMLRELLGK